MKFRPFAREVIERLSKVFEVIVFTASHSSYANQVIDLLDPEGKFITDRLFRDNCLQTSEGINIKDLRIIENRRLEDIFIVDNSVYCFGFQLANGIPILPFYDNKEDRELLALEKFLGCLN